MDILLVWSVGLISLLAFYFGYKAGRGNLTELEETEIQNPVEMIKEHKEKKELKEEISKMQKKNNIIMQNIDTYDGTPNGQQDIPN